MKKIFTLLLIASISTMQFLQAAVLKNMMIR